MLILSLNYPTNVNSVNAINVNCEAEKRKKNNGKENKTEQANGKKSLQIIMEKERITKTKKHSNDERQDAFFLLESVFFFFFFFDI